MKVKLDLLYRDTKQTHLMVQSSVLLLSTRRKTSEAKLDSPHFLETLSLWNAPSKPVIEILPIGNHVVKAYCHDQKILEKNIFIIQ